MLSVFQKPFHKESLDSWCKTFDDISKISILTIPVVLYSSNSIFYKISSTILLLICTYSLVYSADFIRKNKENLTKE